SIAIHQGPRPAAPEQDVLAVRSPGWRIEAVKAGTTEGRHALAVRVDREDPAWGQQCLDVREQDQRSIGRPIRIAEELAGGRQLAKIRSISLNDEDLEDAMVE